MRHLVLFGVLAIVFAAVMCGCQQTEQATYAIDPAFGQAKPRTVAMLPLGRINMLQLTVPQQQAAYAKIADKLQRAFPDTAIITPADAAARLQGDNGNSLEALDAAYQQNNLPPSELIAGICRSLGTDTFLYGSVTDLGEKVDVDSYHGTLRVGLQFALYMASDSGTKVLWTSDGHATVDVTLHQPADRAALFLKGIDLLFNSLPVPQTRPSLRVPGTPVAL